MSFRIEGLDPSLYAHLHGLSEAELRAVGVVRRVVDGSGFPDRVTLDDAPLGSTVLLLNHVHQPADTPYRASHAIYVAEGARERYDGVDAVPPALRKRLLSLRAFDAEGMLVDAAVVAGAKLEPEVERMFERAEVAYLHAHFAAHGCFAARIDRG
jgi:hypothetical protein